MAEPIRRLVILVESPFSARDEQRFGIDILLANAFQVEVWDLTPWLHANVQAALPVEKPVDLAELREFHSESEVTQAISQLQPDTLLVPMIGLNRNSYAIFKAITDHVLRYAVFMANALPQPLPPSGGGPALLMATRVARKLRQATPRRILTYLQERRVRQFAGLRPADFILAGGSGSAYYPYPVGPETETMWLHTLDYDLYLAEKEQPVLESPPTAVFLDEYQPFHPDNIYLGKDPPVTADVYYSSLKKFFDTIEERCGVRVTIAAHPSSRYDLQPDCFGGRQVHKSVTAALVHAGQFVIAHASTSINFAVLFHKPVVFITTDQLEQSYSAPTIHLVARHLGKQVFNIDQEQPFIPAAQLTIDEEAYRHYREAYIKRPHSPDGLFWQIVADRLKRVH